MTAQTTAGLRERKKARTRERIIESALELFEQRGFEGTTIADIAAAADISPRTFFGYFPSKEDVVFHDREELLAGLGERIRSRPSSEDAFDAMRAWILEVEAGGSRDKPHDDARHRLIAETPALAGRDRANTAEFEGLLAEAVAEDLGVPADSLRPHLVAAAAVAALEAVRRRHHEGKAPKGASPEDLLDETLAFLQGGLRALQRRKP